MRKSSLPPIVQADLTSEVSGRSGSFIRKKKKKKRKVQKQADPELEQQVLEELKEVAKEENE